MVPNRVTIAEAQKSVTNLPSNKNGNTLCTGLTNNWNALDNPYVMPIARPIQSTPANASHTCVLNKHAVKF